MTTVRWIRPDDPLYPAERRLRYEVLRAPLGMPEGSEENSREAECEHCVAVADGQVIGCVLALREPGSERVKLLQMAVAADRHGQGIGASLVRELERRVRLEGATTVYMSARVSALGFYARLGYAQVGEGFAEVGLPHVRMERRLD